VRICTIILLIAAVVGCNRPAGKPDSASNSSAPPAPACVEAKLAIAKPDPAVTPHLHNLLQLNKRIYSGGEPHGEPAFAELAKLGVKVIVSVDGAKPDIEAAKKHGLRYVHIPIGYDGIPTEAGHSLARVVRETGAAGETIYFHCHHGKHRGPAAAAVACIAAGAGDNKAAKEILVTAGTSNDYAGLWRDVAAFQPPPPGAPLPELVEVAEVGSLVAAMSNIDRGFDNLKLSRDGGWKAQPEHPDIVATQEALMVKEALHESGRNLAAGFDAEFMKWLRDAEDLAAQLETQLKTGDTSAATWTMVSLEVSCKQCHTKHRN